MARALYANHLAGKHIAVLRENSYEWLSVYFGIAVSGGTAVCIDIDHTDDIILQMMKQADVQAVCGFPRPWRNWEYNLAKKTVQWKSSLLWELAGYPGKAWKALRNTGTQKRQGNGSLAMNRMDLPARLFAIPRERQAQQSPVMLSHRAILYNAADSLTLLDSETGYLILSLCITPMD